MAGKKWSDATITQATSLQPLDQFLIIQASSGESKRIYASTITPYLKYVALITQTSTNAPVATVLENTLGGTVVWSRSGAGDYRATLSGVFTANKTTVILTNGNNSTAISGYSVDTNSVKAYSNGFDDRITQATIEIRVYP